MANVSEYSVFNGNIPDHFGSDPSFFDYLAKGAAGLNNFYKYQDSNAALRNKRDLAPYEFSSQASNLLDQTSVNNTKNIFDERRQQQAQLQDTIGDNLNTTMQIWINNNKDRNATISYMVQVFGIDEATANDMLNKAIARYNQLSKIQNNNTANTTVPTTVTNSTTNNKTSGIQPLSSYVNPNLSQPSDWFTAIHQQTNPIGNQLSQMAYNNYLQNSSPNYIYTTPAPVSITPSTLIDVNTQAQQPPLYQFSQDASGRMIV